MLANRGADPRKAIASRPIPRASFFGAFGSTLLLMSWLILGWLPILGLFRLAMGVRDAVDSVVRSGSSLVSGEIDHQRAAVCHNSRQLAASRT